MKTDLTPEDITPELRQAVAAYIEAKAIAQATRKAVDKVQRELLAEMPLANDSGRGPQQITEPGDAWKCTDDEQFTRYLSELDKRLRAAAIKPSDMLTDYCPALVAEDEQRKAELVVISAMAAMLDAGTGADVNNGLLCLPNGLEQRQRFIDLSVGLVFAAERAC